MITSILSIVGIALIVAGTFQLLIRRDWITRITGLALAVLGLFVFYSQMSTIFFALIKLITGWMACAILSLSQSPIDYQESRENYLPISVVKIVIFLFIFIASIVISSQFMLTSPGGDLLFYAGIIHLIATGVIVIAFEITSIHAFAGLISILIAFGMIYSLLETSILLEIIYSGVVLILALTGSYLSNYPYQQREG